MEEINKILQELGSLHAEEQVNAQYDSFLNEMFFERMAYHDMMMYSCHSYGEV